MYSYLSYVSWLTEATDFVKLIHAPSLYDIFHQARQKKCKNETKNTWNQNFMAEYSSRCIYVCLNRSIEVKMND
jgi:hypothetical protein